MQDFLLEIGTEEIPASFLQPAAEALERDVTDWFRDNRVSCGQSRVVYTPRRLAVLVAGVAEQQEAKTVELQGPPKKAAFDPEGKPTKTALGFAKTHGKEIGELVVKTTPKGEYVFVTKTISAQPVIPLLAEALPAIIARLPFPKNMRWAAGNFRFARPIRWLVALLGSEVIHFTVEDVASGNTTCGPRLMPGAGTKAQGPDIGIPSAGNYESVLERAGILVDPTKRREAIVRGIEKVLEPGEEVVPDDELLDETVGIVETPKPVRCEFRIEYLSLPSIVVATALKKHQRCFSVRQAEPAPHFKMILPYFVAVTNTPTSDEEQVRAWYEKAAESRLKDAQFFIDEDLKVGLEGYLAQERNVTWIEGLGTLADKTERLAELSVLLAGAVPNGVIDPMALEQAARFCKADLLTNLVREKEYTSLQGMIGGYYASRTRGLLPRAVGAIAEHYAPRTSGDALPTATSEGALLSIADKLDNLCAAFVTGSIPTGSADPFALRRQTAGLLAIVVDRGWRFDLRALLGRTLELLAKPHDAKLLDQLCAFVRERLSLLLAEQGVKYDVANAVLEVAWQDPTDARQRCQALAQFRSTEEFEKLIIGQKRVVNILKGVDARLSVDEKMLQDKSEGALFDAARALDPKLAEAIAGQDYARAFKLLLSLRAVIDTFFDDVMVMCDDLDLSANRLALLAYVKSLFRRVADLSQIVVEGKQ